MPETQTVGSPNFRGPTVIPAGVTPVGVTPVGEESAGPRAWTHPDHAPGT